MDFINTLEKERNLIYEPDAVEKTEDEDIRIYTEQHEVIPFEFSAPHKIRIKRSDSNIVGVILIILSVIGFVIGIALCGDFFLPIAESQLDYSLTAKIKGGFFANASSSFITMAIWIISAFSLGFSSISQPAVFVLPAIKCAGTGIMVFSLINAYGILNGLLAFAAFILPSFVIGTLLMLYICRYAIKTSNRLFMLITAKSTDTRPEIIYRDFLAKGCIAIAGCFLGGIIDAVISLICSNFFVI